MSAAIPQTLPRGFPQHAIRRNILTWYRRNGRELPWRNNPNPYHVLLSEIMLQQTQVARVLEKFPQWIQTFPTVQSLASATKRSVLTAWSGMGYNRRALNLHAAAKHIVQQYNGEIPSNVRDLQGLPGFGRYTAAAVACFGYRKRVPLVDVNVRRVLSRWTEQQESEADMIDEKRAWDAAETLLPPRAYYNWNQALMDFGALVCTAAAPACRRCPVRMYCPSAGQMKPRPRTTGVVRETPRRIYRGRVIELLRGGEGNAVYTFLTIGNHLRNDFERSHFEWLADVLHSLQSDGMIELHHHGTPVSMKDYSADFTQLRIRLAR